MPTYDDTNQKITQGSIYPVGQVFSSGWRDLEPLLSPQNLKDRYLFGIPLVSAVSDPVTGRPQVMNDYILEEAIARAVSYVESKGLSVTSKTQTTNMPWDYQLYRAFGYMKLPDRPIWAINHLSIRTANNEDVFVFPLSWVASDKLALGLISIIPINVAATSGTAGFSQSGISGGGIWFLGNLSGFNFIPSYWYVEYQSGFPNNALPRIFNEAIGQKAAITVLQQLQATRALVNSESLSIDGLSQSTSSAGGQVYQPAIDMLQKQFDETITRLKVQYGQNLFVSDIG